MWGVFIIKEFKLTPKGQVECARRQDVKRLRPRVFLSVCDRFNMRYGFGPAACSSVSWCFNSIMKKKTELGSGILDCRSIRFA